MSDQNEVEVDQETVSDTLPPTNTTASNSEEPEWIEKFSDTHNRKFWKNTKTGKSSWVDPSSKRRSSVAEVSSPSTSSSSSTTEPGSSSRSMTSVDTNAPVITTKPTDKSPPVPPPPSPGDHNPVIYSEQNIEQNKSPTSKASGSKQEDLYNQKTKTPSPEIELPTSTETLPTHIAKIQKNTNKFSGGNPLQFGLWAHYMSIGCSLLCTWFGIVAIIWDQSASFYGCKIDGELIDEKYILRGPEFGIQENTCSVRYEGNYVCCDPSRSTIIEGSVGIGAFYIVFAFINYLYIENTDYGWGLFFPNSTPYFEHRFSPSGIMYVLIGIVGLATYATVLPGVCLISTGLVYTVAARNREVGDGGRAQRKKEKESARAKRDETAGSDSVTQKLREKGSSCCNALKSLNPIAFLCRIYNEDKISSYFWVTLFLLINFIIFVYTLSEWYTVVDDMKRGLLDGTLDVGDDCLSDVCEANRLVIKFGPVSYFGPWAKACGGCLNFCCSLILLPVIKMILTKLNNAGVSASRYSKSSNFITQFFNRPITRYIPLQKNIEFHKLCAIAVFFFAWFHTIFHCLNLMRAAETALNFFSWAGWLGTDYLTGAIVSLAMFFIYSAAPNDVRRANFEIFFFNHHWFIVFFLILFIHGPVFFYWAVVPVSLYIIERYLQTKRGSIPFIVTRVEWIPPVMAIQFRPVIKDQFVFKEGQYLYLNCPFISKSEWHPFTISSASQDLDNGPRIFMETGERVYKVPKPKDWPKDAKFNKFCLISKDYKTIPVEFLIDKSDTGYLDYVSVHIKVHGLDDPNSKSWTKKLKEYFEMMNPAKNDSDGNAIAGSNFPFYFLNRDARGDLNVGKQFGPDGTQILCVDGPHSAPAEHYVNYGTVMLIGAGIGLTPCVSILSSLLKYRWQKNFTPEILHFYWVVRHNEIESFQWLVHKLAELQYDLHRQREVGQVGARYFCEINIFVTAYDPKDTKFVPLPLHKASGTLHQFTGLGAGVKENVNITPLFTAEELYEGLIHPTVSSKQMALHSAEYAENRFQDVRIWNGRPMWDDIFKSMRENRQHPDIGVCFCGTPVIGADLKTMCEKYSSVQDDCMFSLHKENF